jgi:hypothetical protein
MNQCQSADNSGIFGQAERDIGKRFRRRVTGETRGGFGGVRNQARPAGEQRDNYGKGRARMPEQLNGEQCAADWANDSVNGVPGGIDPRDFVGNKFQEIENASDGDDHGIAEDFERLIRGCESDPVEMNGQTGGENGEVKIDPGEAGESERHPEKMHFFHGEIIGARG